MPKRVALKDSVDVDGTDLSNFAHSVTSTSDHEQVDVSGFSATGVNEYLAGPTTQSVTVSFFGSYGTGEVHATLEPIHSGRQIVPFKWRPDQTAPTSATNPELRGNVMVFNYGPGAARGAVDTFDVTFTAVDAAGLAWFTVP
jgi:hypothetical protein